MKHWFIALSLVVTLWPAESAAQSVPGIRHTVQAGDSLALLAAEYYGDRRHAVFILVANKMTHPRALKPGERLKIPMNRKLTTAAGDTLASLAKTHLGDARRAPFLAEFNGLPAAGSFPVGMDIEIPLQVTHRPAGPETIANIAAAYFGDKRKADLLKRYNFLSKKDLKPGDSIVIPITHVRVQSSKLPPRDANASERLKKRQEVQRRAREVLPAMRQAWRDGDFAAVKRELTRVETEYLDANLAIEIGVLLGGAYVAYGDVDSALVAFKKTLERAPNHTLAVATTSPKIRDVWQKAGGKTK